MQQGTGKPSTRKGAGPSTGHRAANGMQARVPSEATGAAPPRIPPPVGIRGAKSPCTTRTMHYRSTKTETFGGSTVNRWYADQNPQHIVLRGSAAMVSGTSERFTSKPARPGRRF